MSEQWKQGDRAWLEVEVQRLNDSRHVSVLPVTRTSGAFWVETSSLHRTAPTEMAAAHERVVEALEKCNSGIQPGAFDAVNDALVAVRALRAKQKPDPLDEALEALRAIRASTCNGDTFQRAKRAIDAIENAKRDREKR